MSDEQITIGDGDTENAPPPPRSGWWIGAAGLVVLVVIVLASRSQPPSTVDTSTTSSVPAPAPAIPTLPPGEIVADTLRWEPVEGTLAADAVHIGGVAMFDAAHWIVGFTSDGLTAWRSEDPTTDQWVATSLIEENVAGWIITDVEATDDRLLIAASTGGPGDGAVLSSSDGYRWTRHDLRSRAGDRPATMVTEIWTSNEEVTVVGRAFSQGRPGVAVDALVPEVAELVGAGRATIVRGEGEIRVLIHPGTSVARVPVESSAASGGSLATEPYLWEGSDPANLVGRTAHVQRLPARVEELPDGRLVGHTGTRLAFSEDGDAWEPSGPFFGAIEGFTPWNDGFVVVPGGKDPAFWWEGADETSSLIPDELNPADERGFSPPVSGAWGLAVGLQQYGPSEPPSRVPVTETAEGRLHLVEGRTLEVVREGEVAWSGEIDEVDATAMSNRELRLTAGDHSFVVDIDRWLEAAFAAGGHLQPADRAEVIHTAGGQGWSSVSWEEISGSQTAVRLSMFSTDGFLLVADQSTFPDHRLHGAAIGVPR